MSQRRWYRVWLLNAKDVEPIFHWCDTESMGHIEAYYTSHPEMYEFEWMVVLTEAEYNRLSEASYIADELDAYVLPREGEE